MKFGMHEVVGIEMKPPKPFEIIADRPFLFVIHHQANNTILFMGVISKQRPAKTCQGVPYTSMGIFPD